MGREEERAIGLGEADLRRTVSKELTVKVAWSRWGGFEAGKGAQTDLFALFPVDGYTNSRRGRLPLGPVTGRPKYQTGLRPLCCSRACFLCSLT